MDYRACPGDGNRQRDPAKPGAGLTPFEDLWLAMGGGSERRRVRTVTSGSLITRPLPRSWLAE